MAHETVKIWPALAICTVLILAINAFIVINAVPDEVTVDFSEVSAKLDALIVLSTPLEVVEDVETDVKEEVAGMIYLSRRDKEDDATEAKALELATEYINSRDFKKKLRSTLNSELSEDDKVERYNHITDVVIRDVDFDADDEFVEFDLKYAFFIDGDDEETGTAKSYKVKVYFSEFEYDDDFEYADIDEDLLELAVTRVNLD